MHVNTSARERIPPLVVRLKLFWKVDLKANLIMSAQTRRKLQTQLQESINSAAAGMLS